MPDETGGRDADRGRVPIPTHAPGVDAVFLVLRRMRLPLIVLLAIITVSTAGLAAMPGGEYGRLTPFDAFYVISYTATTIGFGELPHPFSLSQRIWITISIYLSVIGWAYAIGTLLSLLQEPGFRAALASQSFARKVRSLREPFVIVAGYGYIGRSIARSLDARGRRVVVVDQSSETVDRLAAHQLVNDVPGLRGDVRDPAVLGTAGLSHPLLEGVIAVTGDELTNLQVVMTCQLLRPEVAVVASATTRLVAREMAAFGPAEIIHPYDEYGQFLLMALNRPHAYRLVTWLMADTGSKRPPLRQELRRGRWVVISDGPFGEEVGADLEQAGLDVTRVRPEDGEQDFGEPAGMVVGTESDTINLALAAQVRRTSPDTFLSVRQQDHENLPLAHAFGPDLVFLPDDLVIQRVMARLITPNFWGFVVHVMGVDDDTADRIDQRIVTRVGTRTPDVRRIRLDQTQAPAVHRWLGTRELRLADLVRDPDDRSRFTAAIAIVLNRDDGHTFLADEQTLLRRDDEVVFLGTTQAFDDQAEYLYDDSTLHYIATGQDEATSPVWRMLTAGRGQRR